MTIGDLLYAVGLDLASLPKFKQQLTAMEKQLILEIQVAYVLPKNPPKLPTSGAGSSPIPAGAGKPVDELREKIKALSNEIATQRGVYQATGGAVDDFAARQRALRDRALELSRGLEATTDNARRLAIAAAQAERSAVGAEGGISRLGLASQVAAGQSNAIFTVFERLTGLNFDTNLISDFIAAISGAAGGAEDTGVALGDLAGQAQDSAGQLQSIVPIATAAAVGIGAVGAAVIGSVNAFRPLETALDGAQTTLQATAAQMDALQDAAQDIGPSLGQSAVSVVKAFEELGSAGLSATDVLDGAGEAAVNLAAATGAGITKTTEIFGQAKNAFELTGDEFVRAADVITSAANQTSLKVDDFNDAIGQGGAVAREIAKTGFAEFTAVIATLKPNFTSASDAGTSLKTFLQSIAAPTSTASKAMESLGFSAYDAQGGFKPLPVLIDDLRVAFQGLSEEERNSKLREIFGQDASRAAIAFLGTTGAGLRKLTAELETSGAAANQARSRIDNLDGSLKIFGQNVVTIAQRIGEQLTPALKGFIDVSNQSLGLLLGQTDAQIT
ncbi:MAG: phage tail tape measure protein, partial [Casimicrobium sp.]